AALEATGYILANLNNILEVDEQHPERLKKLQDFCETWLARAWRRELTVEERKSYIEQQFAATDPPEAAKRVLILGLKSPQFLYRDIQPQNTPFARAEQLAWALWDSLPDQSLRDAAAKNELQTPEQIRDQIERMLRDTRAVFKLKSFLLAWLKADQIQDLAKDQTKFPGFDEALIADLRTSLELQLEDFLRSGGDVLATADVRDLFRQRQIYLNGRLAKFYGIDAPADAPFAKYELNPNERAGVLTHPYLMTSFAHNATTSPIHRGVFLARGILGMSLRPPPEAVAPLAPDLHPDLTTRQRVALQTKANVCMSCHGIINPLGFALEQFDAVGRFRTEENGQPIDASGSYLTRDGQLVKVNNARELADFLLSSSEAQEAFCTQLFHHLIQQPVRAYGSQSAPELVTTLVEGNHQLKPLIIAILLKSTLAPPPNFADTP
ncbi:MAG: DUF1592 domain-containing protein, partial [Pirellulales bacterium]|nr:DUF1592 domain-containing protein [Pirellulales bacterium]